MERGRWAEEAEGEWRVARRGAKKQTRRGRRKEVREEKGKQERERETGAPKSEWRKRAADREATEGGGGGRGGLGEKKAVDSGVERPGGEKGGG